MAYIPRRKSELYCQCGYQITTDGKIPPKLGAIGFSHVDGYKQDYIYCSQECADKYEKYRVMKRHVGDSLDDWIDEEDKENPGFKKEVHERATAKANTFKQERPPWCTHKDCQFLITTQGLMCGGKLPKPLPHDPGGPAVNTHRFCLYGTLPNDEIFDLCVNDGDLQGFRYIFDALDGKKTSWLTKARREAQ